MDSSVFLSLSLIFLFLFPHFSHSSLQFSGWLNNKKTHGSVLRLKIGGSSVGFDPTRVKQLSWRPRAFHYRGFLSEEECDHLITLAKDKLEKSMVADNDSGKSVMSEVRTSSGMFLQKAQDEVVAGLEARIAAWTFLPEENGESLQILHYEHGEKYEPHFDYFHDKANQELGGHRIATVLMYLSNVERGGETIFPNSAGKLTQSKDDNSSDCAKNGYAVKPRKGDALLFFSLHPDATTDPLSLHGSCPVIEGEKWSATKWIHVRSFEKTVKTTASGECADENVLCPQWAAAGLNRCGKSCRLRWTNYLRPDLKHDGFTPQEEELILDLHKAIGSRWSLIAKRLPGRTDNDVKNYWNTKLRKKLSKMGIDPVTHKPFSQIFSEYGNISGLPNTPNRNGSSLNNNLNNTSMSKSEPSSVTTVGLSNTIMNRKPMIEQFQVNPFSNNCSWDLMPQFQVTNQDTIQPQVFNEVTSSSSPSSSSAVTQLSSAQCFPLQPSQAQITPSPFSWSDFLLGDPVLPADLQRQEERYFQGILSSTNPSNLTHNEMPRCKFTSGHENNNLNGVGHEDAGAFDYRGTTGGQTSNSSEASSSSVNSFVEAILDRDSEMQSDFPELLGGSFDY